MTDELFASRYQALREIEGRLYTDEELSKLPEISPSHPHFGEWMVRRYSCRKLVDLLNQKKNNLTVLEIGCGNGWLSAQIAKHIKGEVTGIDINLAETKQARKVFASIPNLRFITGSLEEQLPADKNFDVIIFAACFQYFPSPDTILKQALGHLTLKGEIHILDSMFYQPEEVAAAKQRTAGYYRAAGFPELSAYYHHHTLKSLDAFNYKILYNPSAILNKLFGVKNPFYHILVKKNYL